MELRKLRHAVVLSKHLNFTKAANALNITQSALSRSIQSLENECQLRLFDRNRNVVNVTAAGRDFLQLAQSLLLKEAELTNMVSHAARGDGGHVALGMAPLAARTLLAPIMIEMIAKPGFHANVTIGAPKRLLPMLLDESVHICVCTERGIPAHPLFVSIPVARVLLSVIVRAGHPLTRMAKVTPADLEDYPFLGTRSTEMDDEGPMSEHILDLRQSPVLSIEDYDILMKITANSDAIWMSSPVSARERIDDGTLEQVPVKWLADAPSARMTAYSLKGRTLSPTAQGILDRIISLGRDLA